MDMYIRGILFAKQNANFRTVLPSMMSSTSSSITEPAISNSMGAIAAYHYYPHNEHMYLLPECAVQQVGILASYNRRLKKIN